MKIRAAAVCLVAVTFAVGAVRALAQGAPPTGPAASLAARIAALEARLAALETVDESDVVGSYKFQMLGIELNRGFAGTPGIPARVNSETSDVVITLSADHTVQVSGSTLRCTLPVLTFAIATCQPLGEDEPPPVTWSFSDGVLTVSGDPDDPDGPLEFAVPTSGVIVFGGSSEFQPGHSWANIGLLVKMPN